MAFGQHPEQRLAFDFCNRVPDRHIQRADGNRALTVPARLLVLHHGRPNFGRIDVVARIVHQAFGIGFKDPCAEALPDQATLAVTAIGIEAVADNRFSVPHNVGDHGHEACGHLSEVDVGVADRGRNWLRDFTNVNDTHGWFSLDLALVEQGQSLIPLGHYPLGVTPLALLLGRRGIGGPRLGRHEQAVSPRCSRITWRTRPRFSAPSQRAMAVVAMPLPMGLTTARASVIKQSTLSSRTSPATGTLPTEDSVAASVTKFAPATSAKPFEVSNSTPKIRSCPAEVFWQTVTHRSETE